MSIQGANTQPNKPRPKRAYEPKRPSINFRLPREFEALCERAQIAPGDVIRQFVADLCDLRAWTADSAFAGNGETAHRAALAYHRVASQARNAKAQTRAAGAHVLTPQPQVQTRATTPIEALAAIVARDQKNGQP